MFYFYPETFWGTFWVLLFWLPVIFLWTAALVDIFRRRDLSGLAIAGWLILIFVLPILGALIYFAARPATPQPV